MKNVLVIFLILVPALAFSQAEFTGCARFKTGKFQYVDDSSGTMIVTRTEKKQVEENVSTGVVTTLKIKWTSECQYQLIQKSSTDKDKRKWNGSVTEVTILKVFPDGYEYTCGCKDGKGKKKANGIMTILKQTALIANK